MKHSVPATSSGIPIAHQPVSSSPNASLAQPQEDRHLHQGNADRDHHPRTHDGARRRRGELEPAQQLALSPTLQRRCRTEGGAHRHRPAEQPGGDELDRLQRGVLHPFGTEVEHRWTAGSRDVGSVHERTQRPLGDGGLDLVGLGVVRDQGLALHLHGDIGIALAHLRQGSSTVLGVGHLESLVERGPRVWRKVGDHAHPADLDQLAAAHVAVGEDATEQHQEHQREHDREEHRSPVADESLEDGHGHRAEGAAHRSIIRGTPDR